MGRSQDSTVDLLVPANFIRAIRESGYVSLSTALAELIDNSLQANAAVIDITIDRSEPDALPRISVEDDGHGMTEEELAACLRFGGSSRFDSRSSFGRFGMGLPAATLSQARQVEVTAWQPGTVARAVRLDVDAVARGERESLLLRDSARGTASSGCRVVWKECDRIEYRRLVWLERSLHRDLGRMFRKFLVSGVTLRINGHAVEPLDPMLLTTRLNGHAARLAFEPLRYEIATATGETSFVTVTFAALPVTRWHHLDNATKRRVGIVGHGGVSILRAGREIASRNQRVFAPNAVVGVFEPQCAADLGEGQQGIIGSLRASICKYRICPGAMMLTRAAEQPLRGLGLPKPGQVSSHDVDVAAREQIRQILLESRERPIAG